MLVSFMIIYNAENHVLGRLCSVIAKKLLDGERVHVVNAEKSVITGNPKTTIKHYTKRVQRGDPHKGPFYPRTPDRILRRSVRGMLPMKKTKGKEAYKRLRVSIGVPKEFNERSDKFQTAKVADASNLQTKSMSLGEVSLSIGAKKRW